MTSRQSCTNVTKLTNTPCRNVAFSLIANDVLLSNAREPVWNVADSRNNRSDVL